MDGKWQAPAMFSTCFSFTRSTKNACIILGHAVETICFASPSDMPSSPTDSQYPESAYLIATCQKMKRELATLPVPDSGFQKSITYRHTDIIMRQIETLLRSPVCLPRFYFQVLQSTTIKLSVSPQPRVAGDPIVVQPGCGLVVKIEGVIQHSGRRPNLFRTIDSVQLTLTSQLTSAKPAMMPAMCMDYKTSTADTVQLTQTVRPHRDFLSGSFLVPLNNVQTTVGAFGGAGNAMPVANQAGGHWQVTLEAFVVDGDSVLWNTGPKR